MKNDANTLNVSVIVRTKDRAGLLVRALHSLSEQTSKNFEVIVINDGGDIDSVENVIAGNDLPDLLLVNNNSSIGRSKAFNQGLRIARGAFIACLDDDDTYEARFIERMADQLKRAIAADPLVGGIICRCNEVYEEFVDPKPKDYLNFQKNIKILKIEILENYNCANNYISPFKYYVGSENFLPVQTLFRRDLILANGGFAEANDVLEDRPLYQKIVAAHKIVVLDEQVANHHTRVSKESDNHSNSMHDNINYNWSKPFSDFYIEGYYNKTSPEAYQLTIMGDAFMDLKNFMTSDKRRRSDFNFYWKHIFKLMKRNKMVVFALWLAYVLSMVAFSAFGAALVMYWK